MPTDAERGWTAADCDDMPPKVLLVFLHELAGFLDRDGKGISANVVRQAYRIIHTHLAAKGTGNEH